MKSVCVYCGSRKGADPAHMEVASAVGAGIARAGWRLIYGAGDIGLMGATARAAKAGGAPVLGFIPGHIVEMEIANNFDDSVVLTETMHERKKLMFTNADAVLALPGGPGTLDELIEALTWRQLGLHDKPVVVLNAGGYWDPLLRLFEHIEREGFVGESFRGFFTVVGNAEAALAALHRSLG